MVDYETVVMNLVRPIVEDKESLSVKIMESLDEHEILVYVYANNDDVARLIGRKGSMASAIRHMMSVASRKEEDKRINIKFESYGDAL
ncbi:MAG: KH domain-containing protein [Erysipelotrichaceae bacterium]|nr:KH domain-containing protein [Erysipelotrichaceae bacterium]NBJ64458.1 KH domain-containing protein [bacterium c-19]